MSNQVVRVRRETLVACMTCPICKKLIRDATTISECLHTFCRKCIYKRLSDDEFETCPVCNIDLGCVPLEKLRADHNMQDIRTKIFPLKRKNAEEPEVVHAVTLPVRRKERSLSSLVVSTPRVSPQSTMTGKRTKAASRKTSASRGSSFVPVKPLKEQYSTDDYPQTSSSADKRIRSGNNMGQISVAEPSTHIMRNDEKTNGLESWDTKVDLWKPLNFLVEAANRTKARSSATKSDASARDSELPVKKLNIKEHTHKRKIQEENNGNAAISEDSAKAKRHRKVRRKLGPTVDSFISPQDVLDASSTRCGRRIGPVWFSLMASEDQEGKAPLPQISANYLCIKDGSLPVSFIQKYLMKKLDLPSEVEVEIKCMGQPVIPELPMHNLVDLWLQSASTQQKLPASIGASAKDFVMVLAYARKVQFP